jgi:hypothetical protein
MIEDLSNDPNDHYKSSNPIRSYGARVILRDNFIVNLKNRNESIEKLKQNFKNYQLKRAKTDATLEDD